MVQNVTVNNLLDNVATLNKSYELLAKSTGENFNIFSILKMESDENSTHSAFLAELLNSKGSHKFGSKFLELFCDYFKIEDIDFNFAKYNVITEFAIGAISNDYRTGGRIDILIRDDRANVIMIENKIYAEEQHKQLIRYKNAFPKGKLFFLTLYGQQTKCEEAQTIENLCMPVSYENDIINWLDLCRKEAIETPMLREVISQYIYLLRKLTNQNANKEMSKEIVKRILRNEETFESFRVLFNSKNEILKTYLKDYFVPYLEEISTEFNLKLEIDRDKFTELTQAWAGFNFSNEKLDSINIKIAFAFNNKSEYTNLIFGYYPKTKNPSLDALIQEKFREVFEKYYSSQWLAFRDFQGFSNWNDLSTLQKLIFGDFKEEFRDKVQKLLLIIGEIIK